MTVKYEMKSITEDLSNTYKLNDYPINQMGFLCCCLHIWP